MPFRFPTAAEPVRVICHRCLPVLRKVPDAAVDAVITDPPYPCIDRDYGYWTEDEWFTMMDPVVAECRRVLKPSGSAVFVLQPNSVTPGRMRTWLWKFMARWGDEWGQVQDVWWWNTAALPAPGSETQRTRRPLRPSLKACVWLGLPDCFRDDRANRWAESDRSKANKLRARAGQNRDRPSGYDVDEVRTYAAADRNGGTTPFNVVPIPNTDSTGSAGAEGHGAGTPLELARWWVRYICPPGGTVLDPFAGTGTTAEACLIEGGDRRCVLIEKERKYVRIAERRVGRATRRYLDRGRLF